LGLINGGAVHPYKLAFGGESNGPVTSYIRANSDLTPVSRQAPQTSTTGVGPVIPDRQQRVLAP